jgi:excisionase family DNA binding protein
MSTLNELFPGDISDREVEQLVQFFSASAEIVENRQRPQLRNVDGGQKDLPEPLYHLIVAVVDQLSLGNGVAMVPIRTELTTAEAANLLNVSRPHVIKLLDDGAMRFHKVGTHRRLALADVLSYKKQREAEFNVAMVELNDASSKLGLPD